jgi:hypothetical protein
VKPEIEDGVSVITPASQLRAGWAEAAQKLRARHEDAFLDETVPGHFDEKEWQWE